MKSRILLVLVLFFALWSCNTQSKEEKELLEKAHQTQKEVISLLGDLSVKLVSAQTPARDSLQLIIDEIEEGLFEIPGYHLDLPGHEGHDHSHSKVELSTQEIYDVHQDMLDQLKNIKSYFESK